MGFTQAALGREAARPKGALGALVGPCSPCLRAPLLRTRTARQPRELPSSEAWHAMSESLRVFTDQENVPYDATFQAILTQVVGTWGRVCLASAPLEPLFWCTE